MRFATPDGAGAMVEPGVRRGQIRGELARDRDRLLYTEYLRCGSYAEVGRLFRISKPAAFKAIKAIPAKVKEGLDRQHALQRRVRQQLLDDLRTGG